MNLKNLAIATAAALSLAAVPMASADNTQPPLVDLTPVGCSVSDGGAQLAEWSWSDGGAQTQFGGGAVYNVQFTINNNEEFSPLEMEVELVRFEEGPDLSAKMVYSCPGGGDQTEELAVEGGCMAVLTGVAALLEEATEEKLVEEGLFSDGDSLVVGPSELVGVYVKAMNPGVAKGRGGRQNYEKTDVCDVPEEEPEA